MNTTRPKVTVIGSGAMGQGIALDFARCNFAVILYGRSSDSLASARAGISGHLGRIAELGLSRDTDTGVLQRILFTTDLRQALCETDLVVEALAEDLSVKREWFAQLDQLCPAGVILASTTSSIQPSVIAEAVRHPERVLVTHYFNPPYLVPLIEIVPHPGTSDESLTRTLEILKQAEKQPVVLKKEIIGFVVNRLQTAFLRESLYLVETGVVNAEDLDCIVRNTLGRRYAAIGPLEAVELGAGWDLAAKVAALIYPTLDARTTSPLIQSLTSSGHLGAKSGSGLYDWPDERIEAIRFQVANVASILAKLDGKGFST